MSPRLERARRLYLRGIRDGDVDVVVETTGDVYIQHSGGVPDGVEGFTSFFEEFLRRGRHGPFAVGRPGWSVGVLGFASCDETLCVSPDLGEELGGDELRVGDDALVEDGLLLCAAELLHLRSRPELSSHDDDCTARVTTRSRSD